MSSPIEPELAIVRPRVVVGHDLPPMLLEEEVGALLAHDGRAEVWVVGPPGCGKRSALRHLAAVFADEHDLQVGDDPHPDARVIVKAATREPDAPGALCWQLAAWSDDDCFDYLLSQHPHQASAAFAAWQHPAPIPDLRRHPELCRAVLDHLAHVAASAGHDASATDPLCALAFVLAARFGQRRAAARDFALRSFLPPRERRPGEAAHQAAIAGQEPLLLRSLTVRALLAAEELLRRAADGEDAPFPPRAWSEPLADAIGHLLHADPTLMHGLLAQAARQQRRPALLFSALCTAVPAFRPPHARTRDLAGARLIGIDLRGAHLADCILTEAQLRNANLDGADCRKAAAARLLAHGLRATDLVADDIDLTDALLHGAVLTGARLAGACLLRADLTDAVLNGADLRRARLVGVRVGSTDFTGARLDGADLSQTDLRGADLRTASLQGARLHDSQFGGMDLVGLSASDADFARADLTGARLSGADLRRAVFADGTLADVDFEGADLRGADLRRCAFHLGGSRSGLVGSEIAGEGSRTGFYGDVEDEARFTSPEDLRKANLRAADLRGALLDGVDLFLVDLRQARLDPAAREHARRCRAILDREAH